jgi:ribosomal protein L16 Arg81 hydroxylase
VLVVGDATGFEIFALFRLDAGDQLYVPPPVPLSVVVEPGQMVISVPAFATGGDVITTVTVSVSLQELEDVTISV